ncbi:MAG: SoxXA-binding protein [Chromatiaceae bacterium]|nr:SoxXA-binding protein [Gammaproteobacteria bacterium]MCP5316363.1 SoxXA-binding protein [Chromatiaceae bacterium]MCP5434327.1 SoxXA-binding protein [Chromatiaceae bacterium]MCW5586169.1 hypothetical protein [Chromatiales bacterium]HPQ23682.1 SoxXA-binding protein [Gammaproteobacteria bacterium]
MKKILLVAAITTFAFGIVGCAQQGTKEAAAPATGDKGAYESALAAAKNEQKKAAAVGGEWRDTGKVLQSAEEAAAKGDYATAKKLADKAAFEGRMGQEQAASQVGVGNPAYLYH